MCIKATTGVGMSGNFEVTHNSGPNVLISIPIPISGNLKSLIPFRFQLQSAIPVLISVSFGFLGSDSSKNLNDSGTNSDSDFRIKNH